MVTLPLKTNSMVPLLVVLWLAPALLEKGSLSLRTEPGTEIEWEGVSLGSTDSDGLLIIQGVPAGTFTVTLKKSGFNELTTDIEVLEGDAELVLELEAIPKAPPKVVLKKPPPRAKSVNKRKKARTPVDKAPPESPEPAAEETEESIAEEVNDPATASGAGYYLLIALVLVGGGIYGLQKFKTIRETASPDPSMHASETHGGPVIPELEPEPENLEPAPFLEELKAREKMMDQDVEIIPPELPRVIDIESIREVEEES